MKNQLSLEKGSYGPAPVFSLFKRAVTIVVLAMLPSVYAQSGAVNNIHDFAGFDPGAYGGVPSSSLIAAGNVLYGTAAAGGPFVAPGSFGNAPKTGAGVVFKINDVGSGYTVLHAFTGVNPYGNVDGGYPLGSLVLCSNTLYGTTFLGGAYGYGTIFAVSTDGSQFTNLYSFSGGDDGANPLAGLVVSNGVLYGVANDGGTGGSGTVFSINTDGSDFTPIYEFSSAEAPYYENSDGANPEGNLVLSGNTLYGTASLGGPYDAGTVFQVNIDGSDFATLYSFTGFSDGFEPSSGLTLCMGTLYGTTAYGGAYGEGNVFSVDTNGGNILDLYDFTGGNDGGTLFGGVTLKNGVLYGAASDNGTNFSGTVFDLSTNGDDFNILYSFSAGQSDNLTNADGSVPLAAPIFCGTNLYGTASSGGPVGAGTLYKLKLDGEFTTLFGFVVPTNNADGGTPEGNLALSGNTLYSTTEFGGVADDGTVYKVNTDGSGYETLYSFSAEDPDTGTNSDGSMPIAGLILAGNTLYGTAWNGGSGGSGTIYSLSTDGSSFNTIYDFSEVSNGTNSDGSDPTARLTLSNGTLYGTTQEGGSGGQGVVFSISDAGTNFNTLYAFTPVDPNYDTNSDGASPNGDLLLVGSTLYGTTYFGGLYGAGTVFSVNTDGSGYTVVYTFDGIDDGANPVAGLVISGNTLYGTTSGGGPNGSGSVFSVNTDGSNFQVVYSFSADSFGNSDGAYPNCDLVLSGNVLYGTAYSGGQLDEGTVFQVNTDGSDFTTLLNFDSDTIGANPDAGLLLSGGYLYGTAESGGANGEGTVFSYSLSAPVALNIQADGPDIILTWDAPSFILQSSTNLDNGYTNVPNASSPLTLPIDAATATQFFRLASPNNQP